MFLSPEVIQNTKLTFEDVSGNLHEAELSLPIVMFNQSSGWEELGSYFLTTAAFQTIIKQKDFTTLTNVSGLTASIGPKGELLDGLEFRDPQGVEYIQIRTGNPYLFRFRPKTETYDDLTLVLDGTGTTTVPDGNGVFTIRPSWHIGVSSNTILSSPLGAMIEVVEIYGVDNDQRLTIRSQDIILKLARNGFDWGDEELNNTNTIEFRIAVGTDSKKAVVHLGINDANVKIAKETRAGWAGSLISFFIDDLDDSKVTIQCTQRDSHLTRSNKLNSICESMTSQLVAAFLGKEVIVEEYDFS